MVEIARMVADWLDGTTDDATGADQSVGTHLAAMTFDGSDTAPTTPTVTDETRDSPTARGDEPTSYPGLQVSVIELTLEAGTFSSTQHEGRCQVLVRYVDDETHSANATRDAYYVLRAVRRSLRRFHLAQENNAARKRNSLALLPSASEPMRLVKVEAAREDGGTYAGILVTYDVRDLDP